MRRILSVLAVMGLMAAMLAASAMPAFAGGGGKANQCTEEAATIECRGGSGSGGQGQPSGGGGGYFSTDYYLTYQTFKGGSGSGGGEDGSGGSGGNCTSIILNGSYPTPTDDCHGKGYTGQR